METDKFFLRKQESLAHSIIKAGRLVNEQGIKTARSLFKLPNLTVAHLELFPYIDFGGTSIGEIARRKNVSKQAISKLVNQMVAMELIYLTESPTDKRIKLAHFHTEGPLSISQGFKALEMIDNKFRDLFDKGTYDLVLQKLNDLIGEIEE